VSNPPPQLIVQRAGEAAQIVSLSEPVIKIGRSPDNTLSLSHQEVSRFHAELRVEAQGVTLTDLSSANGTHLAGQRLLPNQPRLLMDGETFRIGPFLLTYQMSKPAAQQALDREDVLPEVPIIIPAPPSPTPIGADLSRPPMPPTQQQIPQPVRPSLRRSPEERDSIYLRYLPDIFQENDFLRRFLLIFEDIWEPLEQRQDHIEMYFDPATCPSSFLPWLAGWLDLPFNARWPEARQRRLLAQAMELYNWRGTRHGLIRMIEVCTGLTPVIEETTQPYVFRVRITLPNGAARETVDRALIEELIQAHKPAHAGYILEVTP
jgi:phage tail-like protein